MKAVEFWFFVFILSMQYCSGVLWFTITHIFVFYTNMFNQLKNLRSFFRVAFSFSRHSLFVRPGISLCLIAVVLKIVSFFVRLLAISMVSVHRIIRK